MPILLKNKMGKNKKNYRLPSYESRKDNIDIDVMVSKEKELLNDLLARVKKMRAEHQKQDEEEAKENI